MQQDISQPGAPARLSARIDSSCFACGTDNPRGLHLVFAIDEHGRHVAAWTPDSTLEGFDGIIHGGLVSTVLDESMAKAVIASGAEALTAELRVRIRRHIATGCPLRVAGWITASNRRMVQAEATMTDSNGTELAHAWSSFLVLK